MTLSCKEENIALGKNETLKGNIRYYKGDLDLSNLTSAEDLELPDKIGGNLYCPLFNNNFKYAKEYLKQQKEINKTKSV